MLQESPIYVVALSGPSAVGKTPLIDAIERFYDPEIQFSLAPVIKAFRPYGARPDEKQIFGDQRYFRSSEEIRSLDSDPRYLVHESGDNGDNPHAIDLDEILNAGRLVIVEACPTLVSKLRELPRDSYGLDIVSVLLSPLSMEEITGLKAKGTYGAYLTGVIEGKLYNRAIYHGQDSSNPDIRADISERARSAFRDLEKAYRYNHVLVNHDGEGHPNWRRHRDGTFEGKPTEGDALKVMEAFAEILLTGHTDNSEHWPSDLILQKL